MRIYNKDNKKYLSVTSILDLKTPFDSKSFEVWCDRNGLDSSLLASNSAVMGEKVSRYIRDVTEGLQGLTEPCVDSVDCRLREGAEKFLQDFTVLSVEEEVFCDELNYAGRYDAVVKAKGRPCLVDFKTYGAWKDKPYKRDSKKIKSAREQLSLYAYAMGFIDALGVVVFTNEGEFVFEEVKFDEKIIDWVKENQDKILKTLDLE